MDAIGNSRLQESIITGDPVLLDAIAQNDLSDADAGQIARMAAHLLIDLHRQNDKLQTSVVDILFKLATSSHPHLAAAGANGLFPLLAERLSDAFDPAACRLYDLIFSWIIDAGRHHPAGRAIDRALDRFGLKTADDLIHRKQRLLEPRPTDVPSAPECLKCIVLSRVSLGAEIAVTSPVIAKLRERFSRADIVLIGHRMFADLFSQIPAFSVRHFAYPPGKTLMDRLAGWLDVLAIVDAEIAGLEKSQYLIVDPDSRMTQLGLLPLTPNDHRYYFFESRSFRCRQADNLSVLTACWLQRQFGGNEPGAFIQPPAIARRFARSLHARLVPADHTLTAVSLGVGGNDNKRLGIAFETSLLQ